MNVQARVSVCGGTATRRGTIQKLVLPPFSRLAPLPLFVHAHAESPPCRTCRVRRLPQQHTRDGRPYWAGGQRFNIQSGGHDGSPHRHARAQAAERRHPRIRPRVHRPYAESGVELGGVQPKPRPPAFCWLALPLPHAPPPASQSGWGAPRIEPVAPIALHPAAQTLQYGAHCASPSSFFLQPLTHVLSGAALAGFEGMKCFDGGAAGPLLFRRGGRSVFPTQLPCSASQ